MEQSSRPAARSALLTVLFTLLTLNAWAQVLLDLATDRDDPLPLLLLQTAVGAAAAATAWASWRGLRWGPAAATAYGVVTGAMILSLSSLLALPAEARAGLWFSAAIVLVLGLASAGYLRYLLGRAAEHPDGRVAADAHGANRDQ